MYIMLLSHVNVIAGGHGHWQNTQGLCWFSVIPFFIMKAAMEHDRCIGTFLTYLETNLLK